MAKITSCIPFLLPKAPVQYNPEARFFVLDRLFVDLKKLRARIALKLFPPLYNMLMPASAIEYLGSFLEECVTL